MVQTVIWALSVHVLAWSCSRDVEKYPHIEGVASAIEVSLFKLIDH